MNDLRERNLKPIQRPRALRKPFVATIVITDIVSELQITGRTSDLSIYGCFVPATNPWNLHVRVRVTIVHAGTKVTASGSVISTRAGGMSIGFNKLEERDQATLEQWMSDLRAN